MSLRPAEHKTEERNERLAGIREALGRRSIVLIGLMGAGKTAVGRRLANRLELPFTDAAPWAVSFRSPCARGMSSWGPADAAADGLRHRKTLLPSGGWAGGAVTVGVQPPSRVAALANTQAGVEVRARRVAAPARWRSRREQKCSSRLGQSHCSR